MGYIGKPPEHGRYGQLDQINGTFNGSNVTFNLTVDSEAVYPTNPQTLIISLNGVIQQPGTDFTVSAATITFTTAPASGVGFFGVLLGDTLDIGTPSDGSVTVAKMADNSVDSDQYVDGSIDLAHMSVNSIDSDQYVDGSIDLVHMSSQSVDEDNLYISNAGSNGNFLSKQSGNAGGLTWAAGGTAEHGASDHTNITRTIFMPVSPVHTNGVYEPNRLALIKLPVDVIATANFTFQVPVDYYSHTASTVIKLVWYANSAATNVMYGRFGSYGQGVGESIEGTSENAGEGTMAAGGNKIITVSNTSDYLDLSGIAIGDFIGVDFRRNGASGNDALNEHVYVLGMLFTYVALQ